MVNSENFVLKLSDNSVLSKAMKKASSRNRLFHYTSFKNLKKIFKHKKILFNRINRVNDGKEAKLFNDDEVSKMVFVSCFTYSSIESMPMWYIYGKNNKKQSRNDSVRIEFKFKMADIISAFIDKDGVSENPANKDIIWYESIHNGFLPKRDWYYQLYGTDIVYNIREIYKDPIGLGEKRVITSMGRIKRREWSYEKETRLILVLRSTVTEYKIDVPDIAYFLVPIKFCNLDKITITFNPWMDDYKKEKIKTFFKTVKELKQLNVKVNFKDSILTDELSQNS